jgi:hypothetical protein
MYASNMKLPLHRFTVEDLETMRRTGVLAPRARIELLEGVLIDLPRPGPRELETIQRVADVLAKRLGDAVVVAGEPIHPEAYAVYDPSIMVHEWDALPLSEPYPLHRFSIEEYGRLVEVGVLGESSSHQLVDGVVLTLRRRTPELQRTLDRLVARIGKLAPRAVIRRGEPVRLGPYSLARPALTVCRGPGDRYRSSPPRGEDVLLAIDVRDRKDIARLVSWPVYARWGVASAWLVDGAKAIEVASAPSPHGFTHVVRHAAGPRVPLPWTPRRGGAGARLLR